MSLQGFRDVSKRPREFQRYEKEESSVGFVVGIEYDTKLKDLYVDLVCSYDVPEYVDAEQMFPEQSLVKTFLENVGIEYYHEKAAEELSLENRSITMDCQLKVSPDIDESVLITATSSLIDYICDAVTRNVEMMKTAHSMGDL